MCARHLGPFGVQTLQDGLSEQPDPKAYLPLPSKEMGPTSVSSQLT